MTVTPKTNLEEVPRSFQLKALMDALIEAIIVIDEAGEMESLNSAAERMFGYSTDELLGQNIRMLMAEPDRKQHDRYINRYLNTGKARIIGIGREVMGRHKDGSEFPCEIAVGEVRWKKHIRFVGMVRDLTAQKAAEEHALRQREEMINVSRLTTMGEMAAAMAHELNQPLSAIANYAAASSRMIRSDDVDTEEIETALEQISAQTQRAGEVIRRMRDFTKSSDMSREVLSIGDLIDEIRPLADLDAKANNIALMIEVPYGLPEIVVDRLQLQQVILNLLRNGVDAMCDTEPQDRRLSLIVSEPDRDRIRLAVADHGHGISDTVAGVIFNPFFTTKESGMGMGLAICRSIVRSHGGELTFSGNEDSGTTFTIDIPTRVTS